MYEHMYEQHAEQHAEGGKIISPKGMLLYLTVIYNPEQ
jgi:hypothetical protein